MTHNSPSPDPESVARDLVRQLYPHQVEGLTFLLGRKRAILADDMGLGKTRQTILAARFSAPDGPHLVVCPASLKYNWEREIRLVDPDAAVTIVEGKKSKTPLPETDSRSRPLDNTWVIINYDILGAHQRRLQEIAWGSVSFDEAHYLKNYQSARSKNARALLKESGTAPAWDPSVYLLTGTPLTNRPRDLFPLLQLINHPHGRSFLTFAKKFCDAYQNEYGWVTDGASNLGELAEALEGYMLRRTKNEVLDLPPKLRTWMPVQVDSAAANAQITDALFQLLALRIRGGGGGASSGPRSRENAQLLGKLTKARDALAQCKVEQTLELVVDALDQGEKVIVFSCFDKPVQAMKKALGKQAVLVTGKTTPNKRQAAVDAFQNDDEVRVLIANIIAGGVGLNLTAATQVIFNDLDWVPANHWQAEDRAWRIGQDRSVNVTYLIARNSPDEFVSNLLEVKAALFEAVVEGQATGDEELDGDVLTTIERFLRANSPGLADSASADLTEEEFQDLLRRATRDLARQNTELIERVREANSPGASLPPELVQKLIALIAGEKEQATVYQAASSKPGKFYRLEADGTDVTCTCPGFQYRGECKHSKALRKALLTNETPPEWITPSA